METETVKTVKHTELPWQLVKCSNDESFHVYSQPNKSEMYTTIAFTKNESDAKLIVRACNSHYELLQCLKNCLAVKPHKVSVEAMKDMIRAALEKATLLTK